MTTFPWLSTITFLPLLGALFLSLMVRDQDSERAAESSRQSALVISLIVFAISLKMWFDFDLNTYNFQYQEKITWVQDYNINYRMGVDGISVLFVLLSTFLTPICILASWSSIRHQVKFYMIAFLILETMMIGMFCALDIVTFYIFFEGVLIPMFIIIGIWGSENRVYASLKFFLYTLTGSVLMLIAILIMYDIAGTTDILALTAHGFSPTLQTWLWLAFFASFAVKIPMWPAHTWLPDAHVQAPTAGSVILAGVLLKMGAYGFIRFSIPMFPYASQKFSILIFVLSAVAVIYTSLVAFAQEDIKKLIAYSSIAHMSFVTAGLFTLTSEGMEGALFQMLSHGIVSAALFLCVGILYDRHHSKKIESFGGVVRPMPLFAAFFMLFTMASIGLPGTSGFVGELLVMIGSFKVSTWLAAFIAIGVVLGAIYMLSLYRRVILGKPVKKAILALSDIKAREITILIPLAVLVLWMGLYPDPFLARMRASVDRVISDYQAASTHHDRPDQPESSELLTPSPTMPIAP